MAVNRGLFVPLNGTAGTTDVEGRLALAALFPENSPGVPRTGILDPGTVTVVTGGAGWTYNIAPLPGVVMNRSAGDGVYLFSAAGTTNVATSAPPASNSRIDIVYVKQNDQLKTDANNLAVPGVAQGAAQAVPVAPSLPAGAVELARFTVPSTATSTAQFTGVQTFLYTALKGNPVKVRNTTERGGFTSPVVGQAVARLDLDASGKVVETWSGTSWDVVGKGTAYTPNWIGAASWGASPAQLGTYWVSGDLVTVWAKITSGTGASLGTGTIAFSTPTGYPIASGVAILGSGTAISTAHRPLMALTNSSTTVSVWAPNQPIASPGSAGYPFAAGNSFEALVQYRTA